jgi:hypothetical protein
MLLGVPARNVTAEATDFRGQIGVYVRYAGYQIVYAGQVGSGNQTLLTRLKQHRKDDLAGRWDTFSWFGLRRVLKFGSLAKINQAEHPDLNIVLNHIEAIIIHAVEPAMNGQAGRFGSNVVRFLQERDERLGPNSEEMLRQLWNAHQAT